MKRRTLFLLVAGAAFIWLAGALLLGLRLTIGKARSDRAMTRLVGVYEPGEGEGDYASLYLKAKSLQDELASERADLEGAAAGAVMTMGMLFLCWTIDRHRLLKRIAAARVSHETTLSSLPGQEGAS
jgi:hypothetical protein